MVAGGPRRRRRRQCRARRRHRRRPGGSSARRHGRVRAASGQGGGTGSSGGRGVGLASTPNLIEDAFRVCDRFKEGGVSSTVSYVDEENVDRIIFTTADCSSSFGKKG